MANLVTRIWFIDVEAGKAIDPGDRFPRRGSVKTNMAKTTGWAPRGQRLIDHAPFGSWQTQTFIAALRHDRLDAPWVIDGPINRDLFDLYIETQLAPSLQPGDVIILDNLSVHKSPKAAQTLRAIGCWFLPLPPYSLGSSFKCNTQRPQGIGCCDGQTKQAPQQRGTWRDIRRA